MTEMMVMVDRVDHKVLIVVSMVLYTIGLSIIAQVNTNSFVERNLMLRGVI